MEALAIQRELNEDTRMQTVWCHMDGAIVCFSLHASHGEAILTDHLDYTKIYRIESLEFYRAMEHSSSGAISDRVKECAQEYAKAAATYSAADAKYRAESHDSCTAMVTSPLAEFKACGKTMRDLLRTVLDEAGFHNTKIIM